jgi:mannose-6-phosphate isomerase-like protein (cupin superfamily)
MAGEFYSFTRTRGKRAFKAFVHPENRRTALNGEIEATMPRKTHSKNGVAPAAAKVRELVEFMWKQFPGHFDGAYSKVLVGPETPGARFLDFRISSYEPKAYVKSHAHESKEQIYYFLEGEGLLELGSKKHVVRPKSFAFIPPRLPHALYNTGLANLVFFVITTPAGGRSDDA